MTRVLLVLGVVTLVGCADSPGASDAGAGGAPGSGTGGATTTGGAPGTGGRLGTGGAVGTGGAPANGGTSGTGGQPLPVYPECNPAAQPSICGTRVPPTTGYKDGNKWCAICGATTIVDCQITAAPNSGDTDFICVLSCTECTFR